MSNSINLNLLQSLSLVLLLCGLTVSANAQKTTEAKKEVSKTPSATSHSTEIQMPGNPIVIDFVIEDDIMQSDDGSVNNDDIKNGIDVSSIDKFINPIGSDRLEEGIAASTLTELANEIKVYPIPAVSFTNIDLGTVQAEQVNIINHLGQVVRTMQINQQLMRLNISDMNTGVYYLQITTTDKLTVTKTILVQ